MPARAPVPSPKRRRGLAVVLVALIALPSAAFGTVLPGLAERGLAVVERVVPGLSKRTPVAAANPTAPIKAPRAFPRELAAVRVDLDRNPPPAATRELLDRLGILGDPRADFDRIASRVDHPNSYVVEAAARSLGRLGGRRALDRLTLMARSQDSALSAAAIPALGLVSDRSAVDVLREVVTGTDSWRQSLALEALALRGGDDARRVLHRAFRTAPANDAWSFAHAVASLGEAPDLQLLVFEATNPVSPRRDAALTALGSLADPRTDSILIGLARTAKGSQRLAVLGALGAVRDPEAVEILREALFDPSLRLTAVNTLGESRAEGSLNALIEAIDLVPLNEAWSITSALVNRPEPEARDVLAVLAGEDGPLAEQALSALAGAGDARVANILVSRFDDDGLLPPDATYSFLAMHGGEEGWSLLEEVLAEGTSDQRNSVIWALQSRGDEDSVARLLDLVTQDDDQWVGQTAMSALEGMGDEARDGLSSLLLQRLDDPDDNFDVTATTLGRLATPEARDALLARLGDADSMEAGSIVRALGQMDDAGARDALLVRMQSEDTTVRSEAFHAMLWGPHGVNADAVEAGLADPDPSIRASAISALPQTGHPDAVAELVSLLDEDDAQVRNAALSALGQTGSRDAEEVLLASLDDPETRHSALWSLQNLNTPAARDGIRAQASSDDPEMRSAVIGALSNDTSRAAQDVLRDALLDDDVSVASTALSSLSMRGGRGNAEAIATMLVNLEADGEEPYGLRYQAASTLQGFGGRFAREHADLIAEAMSIDGAIEMQFEEPYDGMDHPGLYEW